MNYRTLGLTGLRVSEIGLGCEQIMEQDSQASVEVLNAAIKAGVNYFDLFSPHPSMRDTFGIAMEGRREKFILQAHLCSAWIDGQYKRTREIEEVRAAFVDLLTRLHTDYVDVGMIHYIDGKEDFDQVFQGPVLAYAKELKAAGTVRFLGMSTHNPRIATMAAETGLIDVIMFSCIQIRIAEIDAEFNAMLQARATDTVEDFDEQRATALMAEKNSLEQQLAQYDNAQQEKENAESRLDEIFTILDGLENHPMEYDDRLVRQVLECVVVESKEKIKVIFAGGLEVEQTIPV